MKRHGSVVLTKKRRLANIKTYNRYCKRYVAKQDKLTKLSVGRVAESKKLNTELKKLKKDIIKLKRLI